MALPFWAKPPGVQYHHDDNYSELEVVWTDPGTGQVVVQTASGYIDLAEDVLGLGPGDNPADVAISVLDSNLRLAPRVKALEERMATRVQLAACSAGAAATGGLVGVLLAHVWHP